MRDESIRWSVMMWRKDVWCLYHTYPNKTAAQVTMDKLLELGLLVYISRGTA